MDPEVIRDFERRFDAKVNLDLFEDAEAMQAKLQGGGAEVYDIVVPPDHAVSSLIALKLLAPLRLERIPNLKNLDPKFRGLWFDAKNQYTVAYQWGTMGLFYRKDAVQAVPDSWAVIFDAAKSVGPMTLIDSMRDGIGAAMKYRGHSFNATDLGVLRTARGDLMSAKKRSLAFEGSVGGMNRVLGKTATVAIVYSGEAVRGIREDPGTAYAIPKEGSEIFLDNLAVPIRAPNRDLAEVFINFILDPEVGARISNFTQFGTPNAAARAHIRPEDLKNPSIYPPAGIMAKLEFLEDLGSKTRLYDEIWTQVKAE